MLCELCGKNTATVFLHQQEGAGSRSLRVCKACAERAGLQGKDVSEALRAVLQEVRGSLESLSNSSEQGSQKAKQRKVCPFCANELYIDTERPARSYHIGCVRCLDLIPQAHRQQNVSAYTGPLPSPTRSVHVAPSVSDSVQSSALSISELSSLLYAVPRVEQFDSTQADPLVLSSSVSLRRNYANYPFEDRLNETDSSEMQKFLSSLVTNLAWPCQKIDLSSLSPEQLRFAEKKGLLGKRGERCKQLWLFPDGSSGIQLHGTDHVCLFATVPGYHITALSQQLADLDACLEPYCQWAVSPQYGYLVSETEECGSAMLATVKLFLPALARVGLIERLCSELLRQGALPMLSQDLEDEQEVGLALSVEGLSTDASFSALVPLRFVSSSTESPDAFTQRIEQAVNLARKAEEAARERLLSGPRIHLFDTAARAWGLLQSARLLSAEEGERLLRILRAAIWWQSVKIDDSEGNVLRIGFLDKLAADLQILADSSIRETSSTEFTVVDKKNNDEIRSQLVRERLRHYHLEENQ